MPAGLVRTIVKFNLVPAVLTGCAIHSFWLLPGPVSQRLIITGVFAVLLFYNLHRLVKLYTGAYDGLPALRTEYVASAYVLWTVVILSFFITVLLGFDLFMRHWKLLFWAALVAAIYAMPVLPSPHGLRSLREFPGGKGIVVAGVWSYTTAVLPVLIAGRADWFDTPGSWIFLAARFLLFYVITGISDIRDVKNDPAHLNTVPQLIGVRNTIALYLFLVAVIMVMNVFTYLTGMLPLSRFVAYLLSNVLLAVLVVRSGRRQPAWFYAILVDGLVVFQWIIWLFADLFF
ncbi:MAG: hypothetical protein V4616_12460 [Bacteroidota bacterium]